MLGQRAQSRSRVRTAFLCVLAVHVLAIGAALIVQGCKREQPPPAFPELSPVLPTFDTNLPPVVETNVAPVPGLAETSPPPAVVTAPPLPVPLPAPTPAVPTPVDRPAEGAPPSEYTVEPGDSFYTIARKLGVPMKALMDANPGVEPRRLRVGQKLVVPAGATATAANRTAATSGAVESQASVAGEQVYVVKSGDNLTKIARQFGVTVEALRRANQLRTDRIKVGDKLKIPAPAAPVRSEPAPVTQPVPMPTPPSVPGGSGGGPGSMPPIGPGPVQPQGPRP